MNSIIYFIIRFILILICFPVAWLFIGICTYLVYLFSNKELYTDIRFIDKKEKKCVKK